MFYAQFFKKFLKFGQNMHKKLRKYALVATNLVNSTIWWAEMTYIKISHVSSIFMKVTAIFMQNPIGGRLWTLSWPFHLWYISSISHFFFFLLGCLQISWPIWAGKTKKTQRTKFKANSFGIKINYLGIYCE